MLARRGRAVAPLVTLGLALLASGCLRGAAAPLPANPTLVDDVAAARVQLEQERTAARLSSQDPVPRRVLRLIELGLFQDADSLLTGAPRTLELVLAEAELRLRQYRFDDARALVQSAQAQRAGARAARLLAVRLAIAAWQLDWAEEQTRALLARGRRDADAGVLLGEILLLRQDPAAALEWAERLQQWPAATAAGHRLEAEAHLLTDQMGEAEAALRRALALDPLDPDARFAYGYALWRRGAPALLTAMQAQWALALELDPLHLKSHWHLGNGYTPATILDRVTVADSAARAALAPADSLLARGDLAAALAHTRGVEGEHPSSVLPALWRGSLFYLRGAHGDAAALDSAQAEFRTILSRAPAFGPAHNGVAAVLRQRQMRALAAYDSLEAAIALTPVPAGARFHEVFPDLALYGGDRVPQMVAQQLGPWLAFLPLVHRQGQRVHLPPLHRDLASAVGDPSFRAATTFDQRRWMDIRGVGSPRAAAAGIEYLERGSHQDRNVLLHELVHLVHTTLLTESQHRRVRELYLDAVREERTLDHYAASNDLEFFAQAVEAYFAPAKKHPLNARSMNTRAELERKDPATFEFVHTLTAELERSLAGDPGALRSNRAQLYVNLARAAREEARSRQAAEAAVLLDSALIHDAGYVPAMLEYALLEGERGRMARADEWLGVAEGIDPGASALLATRAALLGMDDRGIPAAADSRIALLRQAADREVDPLLRGGYLRARWQLQEGQGWLPEAIASAQEYADDAPGTSTRLRAIRAGAEIDVLRMRVRAGYAEDAVAPLRERFAASPHDFELVTLLADALALAGQQAEAVAVLEEARQLLAAAGGVHRGVQLRLAEVALSQGDTARTLALVEPVLEPASVGIGEADGRLSRLLISLGQSTEAQRQLVGLPPAREPAERAELAFTRGWISAWRGDQETAERLYREALADDPYHLEARVALVRLLRGAGRTGEAQVVADSAATLPLPLGPAFVRRMGDQAFRGGRLRREPRALARAHR